jgi:N utilization substance protein B
MQVMYQVDVGKMDVDDAMQNIQEQFELTGPDLDFTSRLVYGTLDKLTELDQTISGHSREWLVERMAAVDRNILRLALFEMLYLQEIPTNVSINEALEMAKRFGGADSAKFINGILGSVARQIKV